MNIIFGDAVNILPKEHLALELDTVIVKPMDHKVKTWCVVEQLTAEDFKNLDRNKLRHNDLLTQYRSRSWDNALLAISQLKGCWNSELDSFYEVLEKRIQQLRDTPPDQDWDGCIVKFANVEK